MLTMNDLKNWTVVLLSIAGTGISGYLLWSRIAGEKVACAQWLDCDLVLNSSYSVVKGIPVELFGLSGFLSLLIVTLMQYSANKDTNKTIRLIRFGISLTGFLFSCYLTYIELFVISALCMWCVASLTAISIIFSITLLDIISDIRPYSTPVSKN